MGDLIKKEEYVVHEVCWVRMLTEFWLQNLKETGPGRPTTES